MSVGLLASVRPTATTETNVYTVPASYKAIVNLTFMAANVGAVGPVYIRVGVQDAAGAFVDKDYLLYDYPVFGGQMPEQITGIALTAGESIRVYVSAAVVNFHVNGIEELL